ncbi:NAD(P)-dependent oxidoreductase [Butyricicoccus faecihominis]|uniref:NAD-dependent epimerase/dehydratase family protein n=1 Tax=Butyricicoccus faecihominis TaxID=1712515 RepID=UPI0024798A9E|nr:NAD(P)-dependent oxidoreductase [Butyricicoccus faecihominis]MCQ5128158.1 NAD(P)-dependent oxidoreductase [Butyricicoccus faecihominis]
MDTVVITGADGFIGNHLVHYLSKQGVAVCALVPLRSPVKGRIADIPNTQIVECDISDWENIATFLPHNPVAFVHLAWTGVSPKDRHSIKLQTTNIDLSMNAVRLAAAIHAQRFILPGSTAEYSECGQKINRSACPSPQSAYGATKISVRYLCTEQCKELGIPFIYAVITGIYSADRKDNNVIYYAIDQLLQKRCPSFTKLEQLWDYVYIDDVVLALYLIIKKGKPDAFYTIGHGDNWALSNYIYIIRDIIDPSLSLNIGGIPYPNNICPSSCVDLRSLQEDTGFEPTVPFEVGIRRVIEKILNER